MNDPADAPYNLFESEERTLAAAEDMLLRLARTGAGVQRLAAAYTKSYQEQKRLIRLSDRMQLELRDANLKLAAQSAELAALNAALRAEVAKQERLTEELQRLAAEDSLTGAATRRHFFALAEQALQQRARDNAPLSVLLADLDNFKAINDRYGHAAGDQALKGFTDICKSQLGEADILGRLGGEEFAIVLLGADELAAAALAERIRANTQQRLRLGPLPPGRITVSIGISGYRGDNDTIDAMLARADRATYAAKHAGRNRVELAAVAATPGEGAADD